MAQPFAVGAAVARARRALVARWVLVSAALVAILVALVGLAFAGSTARIADGVTIAGVEVGGLTANEARTLLEQRFDRVAHEPVVFTAGDDRFPIKATTLGVEADWATAVETAPREGEGFGPVRGFRRLQARFFGEEIAPPVQAYSGALEYKLAGARAGRSTASTSRPSSSGAASGSRSSRVRAAAGSTARPRAATIVRALARLDRGAPVALPVRVDPVEVTAADLAAAHRQAETALSAPVRLEYDGHALEAAALADRRAARRSRSAVRRSSRSAGRARKPGSASCARRSSTRRSTPASRCAPGGEIAIVPDKPGLGIDVPATAKALLAAAISPTARTAELSVSTTAPSGPTADAKAMGITGVVGSYHTTYGGIPSRLHNVALVAQLIDGALIAPGDTFSFNGTTGERTAEKGFQEAPVIINGELQTGLGGGICQVSTTVFNAAYEAGLEIDERTNHALYISHYPLGRDATVNYPDLDLKFTNDTDKWLLLRTFVGSGSLTVNLYGTPQNRRVETTEQPLRVVGAPKVQARQGSDAAEGQSEVLEYGQPARATSVSRAVYDANGKVLHEDTLVLVLPLRAEGRPGGHEAEAQARSRSEARDEEAGRRSSPRDGRRRAGRSAGVYPSALATASANHAGTRVGRRVAASTVACAVCPSATSSPLPLDGVLVAEARAADVDAARPDPQAVVEVRRAVVADVHLRRQRLDSLRLDRQVAAGMLRQVRDPRDLEPDDERGVMGDALCVGLGEADEDLGREVVALHWPDSRTTRSSAVVRTLAPCRGRATTASRLSRR